MLWKHKLILLLMISIPAFSGFPLELSERHVVAGLPWTWAIYFLAVHSILPPLMKLYRYGKIVGIAALITLPVVFSGASLSYIIWIITDGDQADAFHFGAHYLNLAVTMLTVIPLSLSMVAVLPLNRIELLLLQRTDGVSPMEKRLLMAIRVFSHVIFDVLPSILEVLREERHRPETPAKRDSKTDKRSLIQWKDHIKVIVLKMIQIGVEGICSAIQYIPLWAIELSQLPQRKKGINDNDRERR